MDPTHAQTMTIAGTSALSVRTIRSCEEVEELRSVWESWQLHPNSDIDYYLSRFKFRPEFLRPHVIVVFRDGVPDAMLVGRLDMLPMDFRLGYLRWAGWEIRVLNFLYAGLLGNGSRENVRMMVAEIVRSLREREADTASLVNVHLGSPLYEAATQMPGFISRDHYPVPYPHCTVTLPRDKNEWYHTMSHKTRHKVKRWANRLSEEDGVSYDIKCFRSERDLELMIRDVEEVARKTYQRGLGVGFKDNEEIRQRLRLAARKDRLRTYILYAGDRSSAFLVATVHRRKMYVDFMGYDPRHERYSPGAFLITNILEEMCGSEVKEVDFGYGEEEYKQRLSSNRWSEATVHIFRPSLKGLVLNLVSTQNLLIDRFVKDGLRQIGLLSRLKKRWRRHVRNGAPDPALTRNRAQR